MKKSFVVFAGLFLLLSASPAVASAPSAEDAPMPAATTGAGYEVKVSNTDGTATITLQADKTHHLNEDFPTKLIIPLADGVTVKGKAANDKGKVTLKKKDMRKFEHSDGGTGTFVVDFAGRKGQRMNAKLKFAICNESSCHPVTENVTLSS